MTNYIPASNVTGTGSVFTLFVGESIYVGRGIQVASVDGAGVLSATNHNGAIVCDGTISGLHAVGVAAASTAYIGETGYVSGFVSGIAANGSGGVVYNEGRVFGGSTAIFAGDSVLGKVINRGDLVSGFGGGSNNATLFYAVGVSGVSVIENSGTIHAERGGSYAILVNGNVTLSVHNTGSIYGKVKLGSGADVFNSATGVLTSSAGVGVVDGGGGNDKITGSNGFDSLVGGTGGDTLSGRGGSDILFGGGARDWLTGGGGNDVFFYNAASPGISADVVYDFDDSGNDRIDLSALFGGTLVYRGLGGFTGSGQVRIRDIAGPDVLALVNLSSGATPELTIRLANTTATSMSAGDFVL